VKVKAEAGDAALDKVVALVSQAQEERSGGQRISAWFGSRYTFFVIGVFAVVLIGRLALGQDPGRAFYASLTVFVALSPCALVIAAPAASLSALAWGARRGLLIRGADVLEKAASARWLALDKTGTLTRGKFSLARALTPDGGEWREGQEWPAQLERLRGLAAGVEAHSTHPLAEAFSAFPSAGEATDVSSVPGKGLRGRVGTASVIVGQEALFSEVPLAVKDAAVELQAEGLTTILCQAEGQWGVFGAADLPREEADGVLNAMKRTGIQQAWMLTGDSPGPAWRTAENLPLDGFRAGLLPADKETLAGEWEELGGLIYVGDGINDAPTLARSSVGVAMGGLGSDVALNAANVVLMKDSLEGLIQLRRLSQAAGKVTRQSLFFAGGVVALLFAGSFLADALLPEALRRVILPLAVVGHEGSTVLVILNGLRLLWGPGKD
jgi:Cd2+/Zn2+-exporting ATPase